MSERKNAGVYQLNNGYWAFRYAIVINGKRKECKKTRDDLGKPFKTEKQAVKARKIAIEKAKYTPQTKEVAVKKTVQEIYQEYCEHGRSGKAYTTIKKQDSLWNNHIASRFGNRYIEDISLADIEDFLSELYYLEDRAYSYVESFLKMFYLILGQAYSRNYITIDHYNKMCINKNTKIHMPKMKVDEDADIVYFNDSEMTYLDNYFEGSNAETAYMLGKYCGLRINECYGLKWENVDFERGVITIDRQMQYQNGLIKLVSLKTRNAKRDIYVCTKLKLYLKQAYEKMLQDTEELFEQRQQNQKFIQDINGEKISSLQLVNSLPNGKIQTVNSMKFHSRTLQGEHNIMFKYHYLRHTYGTNLASLNTPEYLLCNQMGHSSSNVTHKYYVAISKTGVEELIKNLEKL